MSTQEHSPLGASQCKRNAKCPGSFWLAKAAKEAEGCEDSTESEYSVEGTLAHEIAENKIRAYLADRKKDPRAFRFRLGSVPDTLRIIKGREVRVTPELLAALDVYVDLVIGTIETFNLTDSDVRIEEKVSIPHEVTKDLWGKPDIQLVIEHYKLIVIDYKHGAGVDVDVHDNYQLQFYALAAFLNLPDEVREDIGIVELIIVQPRTAQGTDTGVKRWSISTTRLLEFQTTVSNMVYHVEQAEHAPHEYLNPGYEWCRFCPAKFGCPALRARIQEDIGCDFTDVSGVDAKEMTVEDLAKWKTAAMDIRSLLKAIDTRAFTLASRGTPIPGWRLADSLGDREWRDEELVKKTFAPLLGNNLYITPPPKLKSPTQLEADLKLKRKTLDKTDPNYKLTEISLKESETGLVVRNVTGKKLVQSSTPVTVKHNDFEGLNLTSILNELEV